MLIDTHVHTDRSDGTERPADVVRLAAEGGIGLLSITDHDRMTAYPDVIEAGQQYGVHIVPGVELTTKDEQGCTCIHVVGLGVRPDHEARQMLERLVDAQEAANVVFLENVNDFLSQKYPSWQRMTETRPSIFVQAIQTAVACGIRVTEKEMMDVVLNQDLWGPQTFELTLREAVAYVKEWGGVPVLAHPFDFSNDAGLVLARFLAAGGEAVELCTYRYKVRSQALSELAPDRLVAAEREMNRWTVAQAARHGLKLTMASDHHDGCRPMGMDPADYGIDVDWLYDL